MAHPIPRLPVLDWHTFSGKQTSATCCLLANPKNSFTSSGRASILLALEMLGVGPGDKVLVPTYHCPTMIAPVIALGALPIFYPLNIDGAPKLEWIRQADSTGIRAILVAHFFGLPQPLANVREWCDQQGIRLIEDCAHALFGVSEGRPIGAWGDLAIASLTKFLPVPEGGCLVNNTASSPTPAIQQPQFIGQIKAGLDIIHLGVTHGRLKGLGLFVKGMYGFLKIFRRTSPEKALPAGTSTADGFSIDTVLAHQSLTYASRWISMNAPRERIVAQRQKNYLSLAHALSGLEGMHPLHPDLPPDCAPYVFPLWVNQPDPGYAELRRREFPVSRWDRLWPTVPTIADDCGGNWSHHVLQLACHQDLTSDDLRQMVDTLKTVYASASAQP
jgi:perosamine synthetase